MKFCYERNSSLSGLIVELTTHGQALQTLFEWCFKEKPCLMQPNNG